MFATGYIRNGLLIRQKYVASISHRTNVANMKPQFGAFTLYVRKWWRCT